jgi:serine/threonine protein phosphatase PrpC
MPDMLKDTFKKCQGLVSTMDNMKKLNAQMSGTTASVCIHDMEHKKITVAHVADSTVVLGKKIPGKKELKGEAVTRDHKPNLKDEKQRIERNGGRVVFDGYANHRVYAKNARYPGLNMSRCLGDLIGHQECGISCEPEVYEHDIQPDDYVLLLCSDGVWEFIDPTRACNIVNEFPPNKAMVAAEKLAKEAWDMWLQEEGGAVVDDITVILIFLNQGKP